MKRGTIRSTLLAAVLVLVGVAWTDVAAAGGGTLGGKLFYSGGDIQVKVLPASAGYTSELGLYKGKVRKTSIATNRDQGQTKTITAGKLAMFGITPGSELVFGIYVRNTSKTYLMGEGSRNPDGIAHAKLEIKGTNKALVGFEDLYGGGDRDFDDNVFQFTGGISSNPTPPVPQNQPPDCSQARPSKTELWPPNHKLVPISILGCKDPENKPFQLKVLSVYQDEPVKGQGSGHKSPDAFITGGSVKLRAERSGQGDTRVYNITFIAIDKKGAKSPKTTVSVAVPHHKGAETPPKGPTKYNSTKK